MPKPPTNIHPTAIISPEADLAGDVVIGPHCILTGRVTLGPGVRLIAAVHLQGPVTIGAETVLYPGACVGFEPQDIKFTPGSPTAGVVIGARCVLREQATVHASTSLDTPTTLGDECFLMACSHVGHDCRIGNHVILVNYTGISGHCEVGDNVYIGGLTALHQFVRAGDNAFIGGCSAVVGDVIPYAIVSGNHAKLRGLNIVGLKRAGLPRADIYLLRSAYRKLFDSSHTLAENIELAKAEFSSSPIAMKIIDFIASRGKRQYTVPPLKGSGAADDED